MLDVLDSIMIGIGSTSDPVGLKLPPVLNGIYYQYLYGMRPTLLIDVFVFERDLFFSVARERDIKLEFVRARDVTFVTGLFRIPHKTALLNLEEWNALCYFSLHHSVTWCTAVRIVFRAGDTCRAVLFRMPFFCSDRLLVVSDVPGLALCCILGLLPFVGCRRHMPQNMSRL